MDYLVNFENLDNYPEHKTDFSDFLDVKTSLFLN